MNIAKIKTKLKGCRFQMEINYISHIKFEVVYSLSLR